MIIGVSLEKKYSREFKLEVVKQVVENDRTMASVARGLGVSPTLVTRWKTEFEASGELAFPGSGKVNAADVELRQLRRDLSTARQERTSKKSAGLLREREELRFGFIRDHREEFSVVTMCRVLKVSRSGLYDFDSREESDRAKSNRSLFASIESVYEEGRKAYGAVRIIKVLKAQGETYETRKRYALR